MDTYDPYEEVPRPSIGVFSGLPSAPPGTVLVVDREGKPLRALRSHADRLTAGETRFGRIRTVYKVTVAERVIAVTDSYPCKDAGAFVATMQLTCRVEDPEAVVVRGIHDVRPVLVPRVTETVRGACRAYAAEQYADAEVAARTAVREIEAGDRHDPAFRITSISLDLSLDRDAEEFVRRLKENERTGVLATSQSQLDQMTARHEAELAKQRQQLLAEQEMRAAEIEQARLELQRQREKQEAELARERMVQEEALEKERLTLQLEREQLAEASRLRVEQARTDHYLSMLEKGHYAAMALQLAQDPEAIEKVSLQLAHRQGMEAQQQLRALQLFLEHDALEAMDIGDKAKVVLTQLVDGWTRGTPQLGPGTGSEDMIALSADGGTGGQTGSVEGSPGKTTDPAAGER